MRLNSLLIKKLRGIQNLQLEGLQDVNLLLGNNDAGKTTVLEAVMLCEEPNKIEVIVQNSRIRLAAAPRIYGRDSFVPLESFLHLFPFGEEEKQIELAMVIDGIPHHFALTGHLVHTLKAFTEEEVLRMDRMAIPVRRKRGEGTTEREVVMFDGSLRFDDTIEPVELHEGYTYQLRSKRMRQSLLPVVYVAPGDHLSGRMNGAAYRLSKTRELEIIELLRLIDPEIEGYKLVESEYTGGTNQVIEHSKYGNIPLYTYGDGMKKVMALAASIVEAKNGVLLLDEIETSLQASNLSKIARWLLEACRHSNVQIFATTHSLEAVSALAGCAVDSESSLACYRLERFERQTHAKRFSEGELDMLVNGSGMDVR